MCYRSAVEGHCDFSDDYLVIRSLNEVNISTIATTLQQYITTESNREVDTFEVITNVCGMKSTTNYVTGTERNPNQRD